MAIEIGRVLAIIGIGLALLLSREVRNFLKEFFSVIFLPIKRRRFLKEMEELGIKRIYKTRTETEIKSPFFTLESSTSLHTVKAMGMSLARIKNLGDGDIKCHLKRGCKFEFLLLDQDSPFMRQRMEQENPDLKGETKGFIEWIKGTFDKSEYKEQIEVWTYDLMPTMAVTFINDDLLYVNHYSMLRRNQEFPVIEFQQKDGGLFGLYMEEYNRVRAHGKTKRKFP